MKSKEVFEISLKKGWRVYEVFLILITVLECIMIVYGYTFFDLNDSKRILYFSSYIFLFFNSIVALLINRNYMKYKPNIIAASVNAYIYCIILIFWSAFISALDISIGGFPVTYMTILAAIGSIIAFNPFFYSCVAVLSSLFMIFIGIKNSASLSIEFFLNHIIFLIVVIAVEYRNFRAARKQYNLTRQLEKLAEIDALTGIGNRRSLDNYLEKLIQQKKTFTFVLLDVDNFKFINDSFGHHEGDQCLIDIAETLKKVFKDNIFRYGGDEFAVISFKNDTDTAKNISLINRLLKEMKSDYTLQICAGIYYNKDCNEEFRIFELADSALYAAKQNGKARAAIYGREDLFV